MILIFSKHDSNWGAGLQVLRIIVIIPAGLTLIMREPPTNIHSLKHVGCMSKLI